MKKPIYSFIILLATSGMAFMAQGADGNLHVTAKFVTPTCNLDANSKDMTVSLREVQSSELKTPGATSEEVPFSLKFTDCELYTIVAVAFEGTAAENHDDVFALDEQDQSSTASGVGLEILRYGQAVPIGSAQGVYSGRGDLTLSYTTRYKALESNIKPGNANVTAQYSVTYR